MINVKNLRNIFLFILTFSILSTFCFNITSFAAFTPTGTIYSEGVYMVNLDTDICVYKKNETAKISPASTTKIMTCLLVLENKTQEELNETIEINYNATNEFNTNPNNTGVTDSAFEFFQPGITYLDCLYSMMIASACDAANILAYSVAGDISTFVSMMNKKAEELGCVNTHFGNTHGLYQPDNYSCAYDMYLITKYAYDKYPLFMEICNTYQYSFPANTYNPDGYIKTSTNKLIQNSSENPYFYEYARGIKTGSIDYFYNIETGEYTEGNSNLVSTAQKDGFSYMLVTLGAPYHDVNNPTVKKIYSFDDHLTLYKWAFSTFSYQMVLSKADIVARVDVLQGDGADYVQLKPMNDYATLLPKNLDRSAIQSIVTVFDEEITAPVEKGEVLGTIELKLTDETLTIMNLIAADGIDRSQTAYFLEQAQKLLDQTWFKASVAILVSLVIFLVILNAVNKAKRSKKKAKNSGNRR